MTRCSCKKDTEIIRTNDGHEWGLDFHLLYIPQPLLFCLNHAKAYLASEDYNYNIREKRMTR
jgi:hypothetical protein